MAHDPEVYHSPMEFYPERFLSPTRASDPDSPVLGNGRSGSSNIKYPEQDVRDFVFGFGRRICPGKELADATLFMAAAMSIAVFDLQVPEGGREPGFEFKPGTIAWVLLLHVFRILRLTFPISCSSLLLIRNLLG